MKIDSATAKEIADLLAKSSELCTQSLQQVKTHENLGKIQVYGKLVAYFLGHTYTNILDPLWTAHPELKPPQMSEPYEAVINPLCQESQDAIEAFVLQASEAYKKISQLLEPVVKESALPFGGLPEVEESITEIKQFLLNPRDRN